MWRDVCERFTGIFLAVIYLLKFHNYYNFFLLLAEGPIFWDRPQYGTGIYRLLKEERQSRSRRINCNNNNY